jgi:hypothetical protein
MVDDPAQAEPGKALALWPDGAILNPATNPLPLAAAAAEAARSAGRRPSAAGLAGAAPDRLPTGSAQCGNWISAVGDDVKEIPAALITFRGHGLLRILSAYVDVWPVVSIC